jgi:hypothetical protein
MDQRKHIDRVHKYQEVDRGHDIRDHRNTPDAARNCLDIRLYHSYHRDRWQFAQSSRFGRGRTWPMFGQGLVDQVH